MQRFKTNWMYIPVVIQSLSCVQLFVILWIATPQAPLSSTVPWSWLRCMSIESVMLSNYRFCCCCFSFYLQSFPASRSFPMNQFFTSGGQTPKYWSFSFSISPYNELFRTSFRVDWFGRNDAKAETPILWPSNVKNWLTGKDSDARNDWRQKEKGTTEDEMVGWHYWLREYEFE